MKKQELDSVLNHLNDVDIEGMLAEADDFEFDMEAEAEEESTAIPDGTEKLTEEYAGYMELEGAQKDGNCLIVRVDGGISKEKGCCNVYTPKPGAERFGCGQCKFEN